MSHCRAQKYRYRPFAFLLTPPLFLSFRSLSPLFQVSFRSLYIRDLRMVNKEAIYGLKWMKKGNKELSHAEREVGIFVLRCNGRVCIH